MTTFTQGHFGAKRPMQFGCDQLWPIQVWPKSNLANLACALAVPRMVAFQPPPSDPERHDPGRHVRAASTRDAPTRTALPGPPKISLFLSPHPPQFSFFHPSLETLLVEFWWCFEALGPQMRTFGVLGVELTVDIVQQLAQTNHPTKCFLTSEPATFVIATANPRLDRTR